MRVLERFTKRLFGSQRAREDEEIIVDGRIIRPGELGHPAEVAAIGPDCITESKDRISLSSPSPKADSPPPPDEPAEKLPQEDTGPWKLPEEYLIYMQASNKSGRTIKEYCYDLNTWNRQYPLNRITRNQIEKVLSKLHPSTARRKIASLRSLAKWQLREGRSRLHNILVQIILPKIPGRVPKDRGSEDFTRLTAKAKELCSQGDRRGLWLGLMLCCGLRISEIQTAELSGSGTIKVRGKGDKERLIPAPAWLRENIGKQPRTQWRKTRSYIWREMRDMEVKKPHSLRHTYASELIRKGVALEEVQKLLGHSKIDTTLIYAKVKVPEGIVERLGVE